VERVRFAQYPTAQYGAPSEIWVEIFFHSGLGNRADITLKAFNKQPTRMPEAMWMTFNPIVRGNGNWWLNKLGSMVK
jgi:hypothetical protein